MDFNFYTRDAAANNSAKARVRESTRMCMIARALSSLGHRVAICSASSDLKSSARWEWFSNLEVSPAKEGIDVYPAEWDPPRGSIAIKCSVGCGLDSARARDSRIYVAHECASGASSLSNVLHVPFFVHDPIIDDFIEAGLFGAYLNDDIDKVRDFFPRSNDKLVGFQGQHWKHRQEVLLDAPDWVERKFHDTPPMTAIDHARWLRGFRAAIALPGDTPKTNLPPLLALLGIPIISPVAERNTPPLSCGSMIVMDGSWDWIRELLDDEDTLEDIVKNATEVYLAGWSPLGVAKQIEGRLS